MNRGSQWRKWDLHFHAPASYDYQNKSITPQNIVDGLIKAGIEAVAITDHHCIDVQFIKELQRVAGDRLTVFPGIELRSELGGRESVHFIGVFPEGCDIESVWTKLQGNLGLTPAEITAKGGDQAVYVDFKEAAALIHNELDGLITCHAGKKSGTIERIGNATEFKQAVKRDLAKQYIDILEIGRVQDEVDYQNIVFPHIGMILPLIVCSDNHNIMNYTVKGPCWIKADPTFSGLKQVLNEPENRVCLGDLPPCLERVEQNKTKYIDCLKISKIKGSTLNEKWFDCYLPFHHGLVAIIGSKGSGKSALTDTLGLLGNSAQHSSFSFLNSDKFRQAKNNKAKHFEATLEWKSRVVNKQNLNDDVEYGVVETVKYIPQKYLEMICNEFKEGKESSFDQELKAVIYSHANDADRLGQESLDDLVAYRTREINYEIDLLKGKLQTINDRIAPYEELLTYEHKKSVENQLQLKQKELNVYQNSKPIKVTKPETDPKKQQQIETISKEIEQKNLKIKKLEKNIKTLKDKEKTQTKRSSQAELLLEKIENFERQYESFKEESAEYFQELGLNAESVVSLKIDRKPLQKIKSEIDQELTDLKNTLSLFNLEGPVAKKTALERGVEELRNKLDEPNRQYHAYLEAVEKWKAGLAKIIGDEETAGTIKHLEKQLKDLKELPKLLDEIKENRKTVVKAIFTTKTKLAEVYRSLYFPVQNFIENHPIAKDKFNLDFQVSIVSSGFEESFFDYISHGMKGSFCGIDEGRKKLRRIVDSADFEAESGVLSFLDEIIVHLSEDRRQQPMEKVRVKDQLRQDKSSADLYNFLFCLDYLVPKYTLQWSGKSLDQLSPGERGTLLLVFYLLIDKGDIPLIIDQPEENLDNQTVYDILVPCIKEVKTRRQIIIVTHNPNLAVVCDAEQVIYASIDRKNGNRVDYVTGGIENPVINKHVVDVLEGTMPAFDDRDRKYHTVS